MNTQQQMEERLWDYIDGLSSPAERSALDELIAANIEWQQKYRELLGVHQLMDSSELEAPSMRFTKNVMDAIAGRQVAPVSKRYINEWVVKGVAAVLIGAILVLTGYTYAHADVIPAFQLPIRTLFRFTDKTLFYIIAVNIVLLLVLADCWLGRHKRVNDVPRTAK